jgi:tetratricopeptide (TPR) repeat protein
MVKKLPMLTILVALAIGAAVSGAFAVGHLVHTTGGAVLPGILAAIVALILLLRRMGKKITPLVEEAQRHIQGGRRELALKSLRSGLQLRHWHPMLEPQLRVQIGALLYASGDLDGAIAELNRASNRPWEAKAFLACAQFKKRNEEAMVKAFNKAVKSGAKEGLAWTVYAWCLSARGKKDEAIATLEKGLKKLPTDQRLKTNLELLQTGKKMKVAPYGDRWSAFALDGSVPGVPKAARGFAQRPGFRQKPTRR